MTAVWNDKFPDVNVSLNTNYWGKRVGHKAIVGESYCFHALSHKWLPRSISLGQLNDTGC